MTVNGGQFDNITHHYGAEVSCAHIALGFERSWQKFEQLYFDVTVFVLAATGVLMCSKDLGEILPVKTEIWIKIKIKSWFKMINDYLKPKKTSIKFRQIVNWCKRYCQGLFFLPDGVKNRVESSSKPHLEALFVKVRKNFKTSKSKHHYPRKLF